MPDEQPAMYRREALNALREPEIRSNVLKLSPRGRNAIFWVLAAAVASFLLFSVLARVSRYSAGPAVVGEEDARLVVVAFLPDRDRPRLAVGQSLLLGLDGVPNPALALVIEAVGEERVDASTARRHLGPESARSLPGEGPFVQVRASPRPGLLPSSGPHPVLAPGMSGRASVPVRSQSVLAALAPGLEHLLP